MDNIKIPEIGDKSPQFSLPDQNEKIISLKDFSEKWIILYFYPKDNTSGCTKEAIGFTEVKDELEKSGVFVLGISPDSPKSHRNFIEKKELRITLLSDPEHKVLEKFGAWRLKKNYGREYYGVIRSTFIISPEKKIVYRWKNVKVNGHVEAVMKKLKEVMK